MAVVDLRLKVGLPRAPKLRRLTRQLGPGAAWSLVCLWAFAAEQRVDGVLTDMDDLDIELAAGWEGESGHFVQALVDLRWLDGEPGNRRIHDWEEHQPWLSGASARSEASRWAALCKRYGREGAAEQMPEYAERLRGASQADGMPDSAARTRAARGPHATGKRQARETCAPSPSPSPSPNPLPFDARERGEDSTASGVATKKGGGQSPAGLACLAMRRAGVVHTNPSHPDLLAAIEEGVPQEAWEPTAAECVSRGKEQFAYVITVARRRHAAGAATVPEAGNGPGRRESLADRAMRLAQEAQASSPDELRVVP